MPDILKAWKLFVGLLSLVFVGVLMLPESCALRPSEERVSDLIDRAVERISDDMDSIDPEELGLEEDDLSSDSGDDE